MDGYNMASSCLRHLQEQLQPFPNTGKIKIASQFLTSWKEFKECERKFRGNLRPKRSWSMCAFYFSLSTATLFPWNNTCSLLPAGCMPDACRHERFNEGQGRQRNLENEDFPVHRQPIIVKLTFSFLEVFWKVDQKSWNILSWNTFLRKFFTLREYIRNLCNRIEYALIP